AARPSTPVPPWARRSTSLPGPRFYHPPNPTAWSRFGAARSFRPRKSSARSSKTRVFRAATAAPCHSSAPRPIVAGEIWTLDTAAEAFTLAGGSGDVLLLEIAVQPPSPLPTRTYDLASGGLVRASASRRDSSVRQMALALLRTFGRTDAASLFAAETQAEDFAARWSAMREFVALDAQAAHPYLARMADTDPHPEIRHAAAATLALYASREPAPCPA
ncbi:MAG: HEAT repeat domain-containing protein, partial [Sphingopyxis sp.]|nr:HEAT repeat domain-containing protein [Sphingopyxis sp.]